jgi:hypothetical protein
MKVVVITGAGASTELGPEDQPVPMMGGWADIVVRELNQSEENLATAIGLLEGLSSEAFEEVVGAFFAWQSYLPSVERFLRVGGQSCGVLTGEIQQWLRRSNERANRTSEVLRRTLYDTFGAEAINETRAKRAYSKLISMVLPEEPRSLETRLVFATTNYDPAIEIALSGLGYPVTTGRSDRGFRTPELDPEGMVERATEGVIPVIHLHGAVGWYRSNGRIQVHGTEMGYNDTLGEPALLMPDPDKDPARDSGVAELWVQFREALTSATHVLVAGHSLHDGKLVTEIRTAMDRGARVGVTYLATSDNNEETSFIVEALDGASPIRARLGPDLFMDLNHLDAWQSGGPSTDSPSDE